MAVHDWGAGYFPFEAIFSQFSPFKILLKTKDDPWFIRKWFEHHRDICGPENIVIFDNMSTDRTVLDFYDEIAATTPVIRYSFHMDHLHNSELHRDLYAALARSCRRFCFLDTDEFLVCRADETTLMKAEDIVSHPAFDDEGPDYWPGLWLHHAFKSETTFYLGSRETFCGDLRWGKPVLSTRSIPAGLINHNIQVAKLTGNVASSSPFIILHATAVLPDQRIAAAMKKLAAHNYIDSRTRPEDVHAIDLSRGRYGNPTAWIEEIGRLLRTRDATAHVGPLGIEDGRLVFRDDTLAPMFAALYRDAKAVCAECGLHEGAT